MFCLFRCRCRYPDAQYPRRIVYIPVYAVPVPEYITVSLASLVPKRETPASGSAPALQLNPTRSTQSRSCLPRTRLLTSAENGLLLNMTLLNMTSHCRPLGNSINPPARRNKKPSSVAAISRSKSVVLARFLALSFTSPRALLLSLLSRPCLLSPVLCGGWSPLAPSLCALPAQGKI